MHSIEMQLLPESTGEAGRAALRDVVGDGEYFHVYLPDGSQVCCYSDVECHLCDEFVSRFSPRTRFESARFQNSIILL